MKRLLVFEGLEQQLDEVDSDCWLPFAVVELRSAVVSLEWDRLDVHVQQVLQSGLWACDRSLERLSLHLVLTVLVLLLRVRVFRVRLRNGLQIPLSCLEFS